MTISQSSHEGKQGAEGTAGGTQEAGRNASGQVRLGVLGAGSFVSRRHLPDAINNPNVCISALCRRDDEARAKMTAHFGVDTRHSYADWQEMLDKAPLDAVLIATPNLYHYEMARACLERGLHVLIEKPMTIRSQDAHALVALAHERNLQLSVALNPPFWAHCHQIRRALKDEKMGVLESAAMYWTGNAEFVFGRAPMPEKGMGVVPPTLFRADPELNGGGYFQDGGSHLVSQMVWVTGLRVRRVAALMDSTPTDLRIALSLEMENGAVATITGIGDSKMPNRRVRNIWGAANGAAIVINPEFETTIMFKGQEHRKFKESDLLPVPGPVANFVDVIQGRGKLFSTGEHGAHVVEVVEAAYESATSGRIVTLPSQ
jgi:predicted dehydrogenase